MNRQSLALKSLFIALTLLFNLSCTNAQYKVGVEVGTTISSLMTFSETPLAYMPKFGVRAGAFVERKFTNLFMIKTGAFYELKGAYDPQSLANDLSFHFITIPVLAVFSPNKWLKVAAGVETGILVAKNIPLYLTNLVTVGARAELTWQINTAFRLIGHASFEISPFTEVMFTDDQGNPINSSSYHFLTGGLSLAYIIHSFE